jgi:hypothetical protein
MELLFLYCCLLEAAFIALASFPVAISQAVDPDKIDFTKITIYKDLKDCVKYCLTRDVFWDSGCQTNTCFCRASTMGKALIGVPQAVFNGCSNLDDKTPRQASSESIAPTRASRPSFTQQPFHPQVRKL